MPEIPSSIEPLFRNAGWPLPSRPRAVTSTGAARLRAAEVIAEFGGLRVGAVGAGRDLAASDVCFYSEPQNDDKSLIDPWFVRLGSLAAVANAHRDHMVVLVDANGRYYAFTDPDGRLYLIGQSSGEAMERLLLGFGYGAPIPPAA